jgi:hypothetical protein
MVRNDCIKLSYGVPTIWMWYNVLVAAILIILIGDANKRKVAWDTVIGERICFWQFNFFFQASPTAGEYMQLAPTPYFSSLAQQVDFNVSGSVFIEYELKCRPCSRNKKLHQFRVHRELCSACSWDILVKHCD